VLHKLIFNLTRRSKNINDFDCEQIIFSLIFAISKIEICILFQNLSEE